MMTVKNPCDYCTFSIPGYGERKPGCKEKGTTCKDRKNYLKNKEGNAK